MKRIILLFLFLIPLVVFGQEEIETIVKAGIELHEAGKYEEAVEKYKEALKIDKQSSLVNYEIGYAYFAMKEYKKSIKYLDKVIKKNDGFLKEAYTVKGSCVDLLGKPKEAIEVYNKAIEKFPDDYLLYFNTALTQYNSNDLAGAENNLINAIYLKPTHPTSNYLLGVIKADQGRKIESFLALNFFLLIEPNSGRSKDALVLLRKTMGAGVTQKEDKNIEINLNLTEEKDDFSAANMMLSLMAASSMIEENKDKTPQELFYENTNSIFEMLSEDKKDKEGLWWDLYVDFYSKLVTSKNTEAYCYFISQSNGEAEAKWIDEHQTEMKQFIDWLSNVE